MASKKRASLLICTFLITTLTGTRQLHPDARSDYQRAWNFLKEKKYSQAERYFKKAIKTEPDNGNYNNIYGWFLYNTLNRPEEALPYLGKAMQLMPGNPYAPYYSAEVYMKLKNYTQALLYYKKSMQNFKKTDDGAPAWLYYKMIYIDIFKQKPSNLNEAYSFLNEMKNLTKKDEKLMKLCTLWLADSFLKRGDYKRVIDLFKGYDILSYKPAQAAYLLGMAHASLGRYEKAISIFYEGINAKKLKNKSYVHFCNIYLQKYNEKLGDRAYAAGKRVKAHFYYNKALQAFKRRPMPEKNYFEKWKNNLNKNFVNEYSYMKLYHNKVNFHLMYNRGIIDKKMKVSGKKLPLRNDHVTLKTAMVIIRNTDLHYTDDKGITHHAVAVLSDKQLKKEKDVWNITRDFFQYYSGGRIKLETDWIEHNGATVTGLITRDYKGLFKTRNLDIKKISPYPHEIFEKIAANYDIIQFCWSGVAGVTGYSGEFVVLTAHGKKLPVLGLQRRIPDTVGGFLHEFLHTIEGRVGNHKVNRRTHGPQPPGNWPKDFRGNTEHDWYIYIIKNISDWKKAKYRK